MHHPKRLQKTPQWSAPHRGRRSSELPLLPMLFFPGVILYHELLVRFFDNDSPFFGLALLRILLFSAAAGLLIFLLLDLLPWRRAARIAGGVILFLGVFVSCAQQCCKAAFGNYFGASYMGQMAGQVVGEFASTLISVILSRLHVILLALIPFVLYVIFARHIVPQRGSDNGLRLVLAGAMVVFQIVAVLLSALGGEKNYYTYEFSTNLAIPRYGIVSSLRLELKYAIFGMPEEPLVEIVLPTLQPTATPTVSGSADPTPSADPSAPVTPEPTPIVYGYNQLDLDFAALAQGEKDKTLAALHNYFGGLQPSQQNEYTGYFKGKNLILITAEGFSPYAIDPELTPTLYKLANEGFVFNNFYQPDWTQSTSGGEFSVMTGVIPNWVNGTSAFSASKTNYMPLALGWQFDRLGYKTLAYHNHTYTYYGRASTHPNLGYDYIGVGNGLELEHILWPNSDLEMMQATADGYIQTYVDTGVPFHTYYMTVSGHGYYTWGGNAMSRKHRETVEAKHPDASEQVQAYLACNIELDLALEYLIRQLEAAGIADDTVIAMCSDHYPYLLVDTKTGEDYYNELRGFEDTENVTSRYRNTFVLWSGCMEEPVVVDTPCSSIDIVPTLSNLFGLEYDSRLYSGRDIFATNYEVSQASTCMPLVVFANNKGQGNSWITAAGTYEASTKTFTPNEGIEVDSGYVSTVNRLVQAKISYAKQLVAQDYYRVILGGS